MKRKLKDNLFPVIITTAIIAVTVLLNIVLYSLTAINDWYYLYTETIDLTVSGNTDALFAEAEKEGREVKIIFCMPEDELKLHSTGKDVLDTAKQLEARHPELLEIEFYNIRTMQDESGNTVDFSKYKKDARGNDVALHAGSVIFTSTVTDGANISREDYIVLSNMYSGVPFVDFYHIDAEGYITAYVGEEVIASMVLWTLAEEHKVAYFTTGHGESVDIAFSGMLSRAGYYIEPLDLLRNDLTTEMLNDAGLVVISNPTADFAKGSGVRTEIEKLRDYLETYGGSLYVTLDPYADPLPNLESLLKEYGIEVAEGEGKDGDIMRQIVRDSRNAVTTDGYTFVANYADTEIGKALAESTSEYVSDDVVVKNVGRLNLSGNATPVLVTSGAADVLIDGKIVDNDGDYCVAALSKRTSNGVTSKVFVSSGVYLTASDAVISDSYANRYFNYALFEHEFGATAAPYGCRTVPYETGRLEDLTMGTARVWTVLIMAVPVLILGAGIVINKRRKNR